MEILRAKTWIHIPDDISLPELMNIGTGPAEDDKILYEEAFTGKTITYGHFKRSVRRGAYWLRHSLGLQVGETLTIVSPSCIDYILTAHAVWWAGGVVNLINNSLHEDEIATALAMVKPDYLVTHDTLQEKVPKAIKRCQPALSIKKVLTIGTATHKDWQHLPSEMALERNELEPFSFQNTTKSPKETVCAILLSSGTTGRPKAVMLSHHNLVAAVHQLRADNPENWRATQREIFFPPLSHVYALYVCMTGAFWLGAYVCLMPRFDLERYCQLMQDRQATLARLVPPIAKMLAEDPVVRKYRYPSLEYFSCSAAPLKLEVAERLRKAFPGVALCQTYGCTELSGPCVQSGVRDKGLPITAAGTLIANAELTFLDPDTGKSSVKGPGEIISRGPNVMMGYKDDPHSTSETMLDGGWYRTGDLGYIDKNGYLVVYDRLKDIIKYNGFQVAPLELEEVLIRHPLVDEVAVCGVWNKSGTTELVRAYIVPRKVAGGHDEVSAAKSVSEFLARQVAHYKQLSGGVVFMKALPKNPTGKVLRRILREQALQSGNGMPLAKL